MTFAAKVHVADPTASLFDFVSAKTMYGGKTIAVGDVIFIFASEIDGGAGLVARGVVISASAVPLVAGLARQTPRVNVTVERIALAVRSLGRGDLRSFTDWNDGSPQTELNFKLYRQATNKIVGISEATATFLDEYF